MMIELLKEVGRGKRGARDLTLEEAARAAELILSGEATDAQIGAFLVAERIKMESADEIIAFTEALRKESFHRPIPGAIDCAGPYDGRTKSFYATLPSAFVLAACGVPVTLHGTSSMPPKWGVTLPDIITRWGVDTETKEGYERLLQASESSGVWFVPAELACPPLSRLREIRTQLGMRTLFNSAEKLVRYSEADFLAFGVFHGTVFEKISRMVTTLGFKRALIIQGSEGSEDLPVHKRTRMLVVQDGAADQQVIDPEEYGLQCEADEIGWTAERQADTALAVLQGKAPLAAENMTILNSGVRLWLTGKAASIEEGIGLARTAITSGEAWNKYLKWREVLTSSKG